MRHDWEKIKSDYLTGNMSLRELAEKHGVSLSTLGTRAAKEEWTEKRQHHRNKVVAKTEEKRAGRKAEKILRLQEAADRMQQHIDKVLEDEEQFHRHLVNFGTKEVLHKKADTKAIRDMTAALKDLTDIIRDVYGIAGMDLKHRMKMDKEKLKLEKEKAAMGIVTGEETGVVLLSPVLPAEKPPEEVLPDA